MVGSLGVFLCRDQKIRRFLFLLIELIVLYLQSLVAVLVLAFLLMRMLELSYYIVLGKRLP
jgi:hypothetical protein